MQKVKYTHVLTHIFTRVIVTQHRIISIVVMHLAIVVLRLFADGKDYTYTYGSDSLDDSDSADCNSVSITSDSIDEEEECFTVSLSTTSSLAGLTLNPKIATVCIIDDDREFLSIETCKSLIACILPL